MKQETAIQQGIMVALSKIGYRVFRNNVAKAWVGKAIMLAGGLVTTTQGGSMTVPPGSVLILAPRRLHAGLFKGSSDLIGWHTIQVTPEMVGQKLAVFTGVEVKTSTGRMSTEQKVWDNVLNLAGAEHHVLRSEDDVQLLKPRVPK